jgi:hypothetical protein
MTMLIGFLPHLMIITFAALYPVFEPLPAVRQGVYVAALWIVCGTWLVITGLLI